MRPIYKSRPWWSSGQRYRILVWPLSSNPSLNFLFKLLLKNENKQERWGRAILEKSYENLIHDIAWQHEEFKNLIHDKASKHGAI